MRKDPWPSRKIEVVLPNETEGDTGVLHRDWLRNVFVLSGTVIVLLALQGMLTPIAEFIVGGAFSLF